MPPSQIGDLLRESVPPSSRKCALGFFEVVFRLYYLPLEELCPLRRYCVPIPISPFENLLEDRVLPQHTRRMCASEVRGRDIV